MVDSESQLLATHSHKKNLMTRRLGAWAGVTSSVLFVGVFTIEGATRPGYDAASMYISALSLGPRGWVQITNFIVTGLLIAVFAKGVEAEFAKITPSGVALLLLVGFSLIASGPFVMDPATFVFFKMSTHSKLHYLFGAILFSLAPISCFVFFRAFGRCPAWEPFRWWTLGFGMVSFVGIGFLKVAALSSNVLHPWLGLVQRTTLIPFFVWIFVFGLNMLKGSAQQR